MTESESMPSFDEFPIPVYEDWYTAAVESLDGTSFEKALTTTTYEGLTLQPIYLQHDVNAINHLNTHPGIPPFVRGAQASGYLHQPWHIAQELPSSTPGAFNAALHSDLERGQTTVNLEEISLNSTDDLAQALAGIDLTQYPVLRTSGTDALSFVNLLTAYLGTTVAGLRGCIASDPLSELARTGTLPNSIGSLYDEMAQLTSWAADHAPDLKTITVNAHVYHDGGAHAVQELAFAISAGVAHIREMLERGLNINTITPRMHFNFAIGTQFFTEVAKLRAARLVWTQIIRAFDGSDPRINLHSRTGKTNKTISDPYVNMLRTTIEAFAGAAGGTDSMQVTPFDETFRQPDEFSQRIARNQQLILQHEAGLTRTIDPAGGSYYVEYLTDWLARQAWALFQEVEKQGGLYSALQAGFVQEQIAQVAAQRMTNLERRKEVLVGINMYPNPAEDSLPVKGRPVPGTQETPMVTPLRPFRLAALYETLRENAAAFRHRTGAAPRIFLANLGSYRARADFTTGFFEVGGFEIVSRGRMASPEEAAQAAIDSGAEAVVICSTDDNYPQIVPPLVNAIKAQKPDVVVMLAGYPQDQIEGHRAAGIDEFIHIRANCYETNRWLQQRIGVSI